MGRTFSFHFYFIIFDIFSILLSRRIRIERRWTNQNPRRTARLFITRENVVELPVERVGFAKMSAAAVGDFRLDRFAGRAENDSFLGSSLEVESGHCWNCRLLQTGGESVVKPVDVADCNRIDLVSLLDGRHSQKLGSFLG